MNGETVMNSAEKLREALGRLRAELWNNSVIAGKKRFELFDIADRALAAPARQCDIGTAKEQAERMANFCGQQYKKAKPEQHICHECEYHKSCIDHECTFAWMQSPFKESGVAK